MKLILLVLVLLLVTATAYGQVEKSSRPSFPVPVAWAGLIGEYDWGGEVLYILENDGQLHALKKGQQAFPLTDHGSDVFAFPDAGQYPLENLKFIRDVQGRAVRAEFSGQVFPRRNIEAEFADSFHVSPQQGIQTLTQQALKADPPQESGEFRPSELVDVTTYDPAIRLDIRYAGFDNFLGEPVYSQAKAFLQRPAAIALARVNKRLGDMGYGLLVHDAYRPWYVSKIFWDATPEKDRIFVADPAQGSVHNRGSAVDLTLYDLSTGKTVEMVGVYDEMSARSYPDYPGGTSLQRWYRELLRRVMEAEDFSVYEYEWWHFDYRDWRKYKIQNDRFEDIAVSAVANTAPTVSTLPDTPTVDVTDIYHGVEVHDPYRWLEDGEDLQVRAWGTQQNTHFRSYIDRISYTEDLRNRLGQIMYAQNVSYSSPVRAAGQLYALKHQPPLEQPILVVMSGPDAPESERTIVDINQYDATHATTIDWYAPSPDGKLVAVSLSVGGSESGDLHVFDAATGEPVYEKIMRVHRGTAGGDVAWSADGTGFYYTRYPRPGERPQEEEDFHLQLWYHTLGQPVSADRYELGRELPRTAQFQLEADHQSGRLLARVQHGDSGRVAHFVRMASGTWRQIDDFEDEIFYGFLGAQDTLFAISYEQAPMGKLIKLSLNDPDLEHAETIIPEGSDAIYTHYWLDTHEATPNRIYLTYQLGGPTQVRVFDYQGNRLDVSEIAPVTAVKKIVGLDGDDVLLETHSYVEPLAWYRFSPPDAVAKKTRLSTPGTLDLSDIVVTREFAASKDGTRVPVSLMHKRGITRNGENPLILYGYGGYGISVAPRYLSQTTVWLEQGGIYVVANIRGGGEFGEAWHRDGMLTKKQNVFDDFAAVMQHLIEKEYTKPEKFAIHGGSNGGILMGAMINQHPELFRAVVSEVGVYDMLRTELTPNGTFNIPEFGTVRYPDHFRALYAYSPYHNVAPSARRPAVLLMAGDNDTRVNPYHSRKLAARLQASDQMGNPVFLRTSAASGHGSGTPLGEQVSEAVDMFAFLFDQLGVEYRSEHTGNEQ